MQKEMRKKIYVVAGFLMVLSLVLFLFQTLKNKNNYLPKNVDSTVTVQNPKVMLNPVVTDNQIEPQKTIPASIPILMYHYIRKYSDANDLIGENLSVSPEKFEQQIVWLKSGGYQTVFPSFFKNPEPISFKPLILTFDDGYQDAYSAAFPIMQKYEMRGVFYLIVNKIGTPGYLSWDEIIEMQKAGMVFGSHTLSHPDLRNLSQANLEKELRESKIVLEQKLGTEIVNFCYPSGKYDEAILSELQKDKFQTAVTTNSGISNLKDDPLTLKRFRIKENTIIQSIIVK